jgi:hypothetical protein
VHFGLGGEAEIAHVEITHVEIARPSGTLQRIDKPQPNRVLG